MESGLLEINLDKGILNGLDLPLAESCPVVTRDRSNNDLHTMLTIAPVAEVLEANLTILDHLHERPFLIQDELSWHANLTSQPGQTFQHCFCIL